jgi:glutaredoxin
MSNYFLKVILLDSCSYSNAAVELLKSHNIEFDKVIVSNENKVIFKSNRINTFPQIYLCKNNNNGTQLLGGYDDLVKFVNMFKGKSYNETLLNDFMRESSWSKKATLRLIQIINNKI